MGNGTKHQCWYIIVGMKGIPQKEEKIIAYITNYETSC
jgi:hypothetical protein